MPTPTYFPLANITLGSSASSVTFSSIPATYRDLVLVVEGPANSGDFHLARFNGDSSSNYPAVIGQGTGSVATSVAGTNTGAYLGDTSGSSRFFSYTSIMDYSATDKHKTVLNRTHYSAVVTMTAARWANTAAITSVALVLNNGASFSSATNFALYGISA